ncbi:hypothetical protein LX36DRAFT_445917 [Colletotrichum falcatum]|nr:hypothetical protein LX36DRAFT_445917 [Colletotrichum falcatum]
MPRWSAPGVVSVFSGRIKWGRARNRTETERQGQAYGVGSAEAATALFRLVEPESSGLLCKVNSRRHVRRNIRGNKPDPLILPTLPDYLPTYVNPLNAQCGRTVGWTPASVSDRHPQCLLASNPPSIVHSPPARGHGNFQPGTLDSDKDTMPSSPQDQDVIATSRDSCNLGEATLCCHQPSALAVFESSGLYVAEPYLQVCDI